VVKHVIFLSFVSLFFLSPGFTEHGDSESVKQLVWKLGAADVLWRDRQEAERRLKEMPSGEVLPVLLPEIAKGMPGGPIWNSAGPEHDRRAPGGWQVYYTINRVWKHHLKVAPSEDIGNLLLVLLKEANTSAARVAVVDGLLRHWVPEAEKPVSELLQEKDEDYSVRRSSAQVLLRHMGVAYHSKVLEIVRLESGQLKYALFVLLLESAYAKQSGVDPGVVCLGFGMIEGERKANPGSASAGYFIARSFEGYLNQKFVPDSHLGKYKGEYGLNVNFFRDTVNNALKWWAENKQRYKKEESDTEK